MFENNSYNILSKYRIGNKYAIISGVTYKFLETEYDRTNTRIRELSDEYTNINKVTIDNKEYLLLEERRGTKFAIKNTKSNLFLFEYDFMKFFNVKNVRWTPSKTKRVITYKNTEFPLYSRTTTYILPFDKQGVRIPSDSNYYGVDPDIDEMIRNGEWHDDMM